MSCPHCIHCQKGVEKGGLSLLSGSDQGKSTDQDQKETPKKPVRGPAREYTQAFEVAWKAYGRKEQKFEAFGVWLIQQKGVGGEPQLLTLILTALKWQGPLWASEGWKFAPYFERYLKRRKWEDEPPPRVEVPARPRVESFRERDERIVRERIEREREQSDRIIEATNRKAAEYRSWTRGGK